MYISPYRMHGHPWVAVSVRLMPRPLTIVPKLEARHQAQFSGISNGISSSMQTSSEQMCIRDRDRNDPDRDQHQTQAEPDRQHPHQYFPPPPAFFRSFDRHANTILPF